MSPSLTHLGHLSSFSSSQPGTYTYTKDPKGLTRVLLVMLGLSLGVSCLGVVSDWSQLSLLSGSFTEAQGIANDRRQAQVGFVAAAILIATAIPFLMWVHRAVRNSHGFGAADLKFTPGWAVGQYFIPFINLVRPYQSMKMIWAVSRNPKQWQSQDGGAIVGWWWGLWIAGGFLGQFSVRMALSADSLEDFRFATVLSIISGVIGVIVSVVAMRLVHSITRNQERLVGRDQVADGLVFAQS